MATKDSKKGGGQKILTVVMCLIITVTAAFSAAACSSDKTQKAKKPQKKLQESTLVGYWSESSDELDDGEEIYYAFKDDGSFYYYELVNGDIQMALFNGKYTCADNKITLDGNIQFFQKDESGHDTINSGAYESLYKCKSWTNNKIKFVEEATSAPDKMTLNRLDTDEKVKDAENKRMDKLDAIDAQIDAETGEKAY